MFKLSASLIIDYFWNWYGYWTFICIYFIVESQSWHYHYPAEHHILKFAVFAPHIDLLTRSDLIKQLTRVPTPSRNLHYPGPLAAARLGIRRSILALNDCITGSQTTKQKKWSLQLTYRFGADNYHHPILRPGPIRLYHNLHPISARLPNASFIA